MDIHVSHSDEESEESEEYHPNWDDICILFSQDRADGQGSRTIQETSDEIEVDSATIPYSLDKCDEVDVISDLLARKKRKETTSSSCSIGPKKKTSSTTIISDCMQRMATDFSDYLAVERKKSELLLTEKELMLAEKKKINPQKILAELKAIELDDMQMIKAVDLMMHDHILFNTFVGMPTELKYKWGFLTGLPPSHKKWKQRFVFVEFPPDQFPLSNREWADWVIKPERVHPEPTKELEEACEKLLKGDPVTGKPYAYGGWVYRLPNPDGGASATHDAEDNRADSPDGHAEAGSPHPDMNFNRMTTIIEDDDDDVQVLHSNRSPLSNSPSPPHFPGMDGATSARCSPVHDQSQKLNSPPATHLFESDRVPYPKKDVKAKGKVTGHSSSQKRKSSHKTSRGERRKKVRLSDLEGESIEVTFLSLAQKLSKVGVLSEEVGRSLLESKDQVSELTLLLDSAKLEINDRVEREKRLEEELKEERARLDEERAKLVEAKRKLVELEGALAQAEETARSKEQSFPDDAARWVAGHHVETARSILVGPEETMAFFKTMYKEPEGKKMITDIGSYGFQCGLKDERSLLYSRLQKRDPSFDPAKVKLPALYKEEPAPPFPLE
ncbi:unnamed protein product [Cuscuta campestris]|uniref:Uncharacterized protein n=1 Tax=Cuscuta campestris TaxID=132261 RepID=A0A484KCS6_9ASTE|nr:unnamed protein product [Cuscuta campestris]